MTHPEYRFFYVRAEPSLAAKTAFALTTHKPHKREPKGFPVACVAFRLSGVDGEFVDFAFATHNPLDTYSRDAARAWALFYLLIKNKYRGTVSHHDKGLIIKTRIMELLALPGAPLRVQKAARYWLSRYTKPSRPQPPKPSKVDALPSTSLRPESPRPQLVARKRKK